MAAQVINDDLIVIGSLCVGVDCTASESFGFDTQILKENNLRIFFNDTSSSASFPSNDWRFVANDSSNGGANFLAIEDATAGNRPFVVEAGAGANALIVDSSGQIGMGTNNPVVELQIVDGDSPTLRLEQNGSSGFTPQTWDIAGNEANFFVRDATNSSQLPFKILPNSPTNALTVNSVGVGIGIQNASQSLDVRGADGTTQVLVKDTGDQGPEQMLRLENQGAPQLYMLNTKNGNDWLFSAGASMLMSPTENAGDAVFDLAANGNLTIDGTLTESSDKNRKTAIEPVDPDTILTKVSQLPVAEWTYIHDAEEGIRHIGPMAQDFHAAFGVGADETGISSLDGTGVALAAIQALNAQNAALRADLDAALEAIDALRAAN
ncbi:Chaperone of endosialidase [Jannaschia seohaensis]|uniref:Chaperone of endosialidase n=2 Tax=Jannaschia seohaensis TaxID=475081 RepID=A0A2Y9B034_9RHOB|nr:endosialidase-like protein [Jannaschia seohaensis]SSA49465.1 Chaperone of endosialidase [Jannaschia seohaensis]